MRQAASKRDSFNFHSGAAAERRNYSETIILKLKMRLSAESRHVRKRFNLVSSFFILHSNFAI
jgi:hypothetical protein